jgi:hypothetical protein
VQKDPAGHSVHAVAPAAEYQPMAHGVTVVALQKEPAGHCVQVAAAAAE